MRELIVSIVTIAAIGVATVAVASAAAPGGKVTYENIKGVPGETAAVFSAPAGYIVADGRAVTAIARDLRQMSVPKTGFSIDAGGGGN